MNPMIDFLFDAMLAVIRTGGYALVTAVAAELLVLLLNSLRVPKRIGYLLLCVVLLRMVVPVGIPSPLSIFNLEFVQDSIEMKYQIPDNGGYVGDYDIAIQGSDEYDAALYAGLSPNDNSDLPYRYVYYTENENGEIAPAKTYRETYGTITVVIWLGSILLFWGYGILSALLLKRRVATATILEPGVYETDQITAPFILGMFRPKIYLPTGLDENQRKMVLCHERMHLRWGDHIVKIIAYFAAGLHWYNIWLGLYFYRIFLGQMEEACDQDVIRSLGPEYRADYSEALLSFSTKRQLRQVMTVAFGESWVKERIRLVLKYKKPWRWLTVPAMLLALTASIVLGTNGLAQNGTIIKAKPLTAEELPDIYQSPSGIQYEMFKASDVSSVVFDLEIWTSEGLYQRKEILRLSSQADPGLALSKLSFNWFFDLQSNATLQPAVNFHYRLQFEGKKSSGTFLLPTEEEIAFLFPEELPQTLCTLSTNHDAVVFFALLGEPSQTVDSVSEQDLSSLPEGQLAVVLRYRQYSSILPLEITAHDLLPEEFTPEYRIDISAENLTKTLKGDQAKEVLRLLSAVSFRDHVYLGYADVADEGFPSIILYDKKGDCFEVTLCDDKILLYNCQNGSLQRALSRNPLSVRLLNASIFRNLGIEKSAGEVFQLPQTIGDSALGWTLTQSFPRKDIWLYTDVNSGDSLLISGLNFYQSIFPSDVRPLSLFCQDLNADGNDEIIAICQDDTAQRLYILQQGSGDIMPFDIITQGDLNYWMDSSFGEYADNDDLVEISMDIDPSVSLQFSRTALLGDMAAGKYINNQTEEHYQNTEFSIEDGKLTVKTIRVLHFRLKDQDVFIPCAKISATIQYLGRHESEPFLFTDFVIRPLS